MEYVKEYSHTEATKRINERREQRYRRNQVPQYIEKGEDERPQQKSRHQNRPNHCQQRRIFDGHGRSMTAVSVRRNSGSVHLGFEQKTRRPLCWQSRRLSFIGDPDQIAKRT